MQMINTPYILVNSIGKVIKSLRDNFINLFKWFLDNQRKADSKKYHLITNKKNCMNLNVGDINIENSTCKKLLKDR